MKKTLIALVALSALLAGCIEPTPPSSDKRMAVAQEATLAQAVSAVGMPSITNFREKRLLKMIYELRDQDGLRTYTYIVAQNTGARNFLCDSIGYPINDATGYTSPDKIVKSDAYGFGTVIQAEPNALFTPDTSNAYWVMCLDTKAGKPTPTFVAGYPLVSTYALH
jgi:hypothetical protein